MWVKNATTIGIVRMDANVQPNRLPCQNMTAANGTKELINITHAHQDGYSIPGSRRASLSLKSDHVLLRCNAGIDASIGVDGVIAFFGKSSTSIIARRSRQKTMLVKQRSEVTAPVPNRQASALYRSSKVDSLLISAFSNLTSNAVSTLFTISWRSGSISKSYQRDALGEIGAPCTNVHLCNCFTPVHWPSVQGCKTVLLF